MRRFNRGWIQARIDLEECPRCGLPHEGILAKRFRQKSEGAPGWEHTHFGFCPVTNEPFHFLIGPSRRPWISIGPPATGNVATTAQVVMVDFSEAC
jgi:hypothetical protein